MNGKKAKRLRREAQVRRMHEILESGGKQVFPPDAQKLLRKQYQELKRA